jgi:hypothetical protein
MARLRYGLLLTLLGLPMAGCDEILVDVGPVEVRVHNASAGIMEDVIIHFPEESAEYGTLAPGEASGYRTVELAYRIASVALTIDGEARGLQVIDYVGEEPLAGGRYTYRLGLFEGRSVAWSVIHAPPV